MLRRSSPPSPARWRSSGSARGGAAGDQALALVFYTGIALGVVSSRSRASSTSSLFQYLFGSILTVTRGDLVLVAILGAAGLATIGLLLRALFAAVLDEEGARVAGVPIGFLNVVVAVLAALTVACRCGSSGSS